MVRKYAVLLLTLGALCPGVVAALGLGELTLKSYLNEPLRAEVDLLEVGGLNPAQVKIRLATREDFERAGVERAYFLTSLKFDIELASRDRGVLRISSELPVREPYLDFLVEVRWPDGRLLREYTVLLDLPVFAGPGSAAVNAVVAPGSDESPTLAADASDADSGVLPPRRDEAPAGPGDYATRDPVTPGSEYTVQKKETLWSIASRAQPEGATVQQTMLDIKRLNPEAFIDGNINQLKAGYVLRLPSSADISGSPGDAIADIREQTEQWPATDEDSPAQRMVDMPVESSPDEVASGTAQGRLQIAGSEELDESVDAGLEGEVTASLEKLDRAQRDNADLQARLDAMEEQLATVRRLLSLKDEQIAALQASLADSQAAAPGESAAVSGTIEPEADEAADTESAGSVRDTAEAPEAAPQAEPEPEFSSWLTYTLLGSLLLVVLIAYLMRNRLGARRQPAYHAEEPTMAQAVDEEDDEFAGVELADSGIEVDEFGEDVLDDQEETIELESMTDAEEEAYAAQFESGDALAEADIYIAYGRYPQAIELLKTAIGAEPANSAYRLKLLEVCVEMDEREEFREQYAELAELGDADALRRAGKLIGGADGGDDWLLGLSEASVAGAPDEGGSAQAGQEGDLDLDLEEDLDLDFDAASLFQDEDDEHIDINLEIDERLEAGGVNFDEAREQRLESFDMGQAEVAASAPSAEEEVLDLPELELDDFEVNSDEVSDMPQVEDLTREGGEELLKEFGELEIEDDGRGAPGEPASEDLVFASDGDEVSTKMDLARAYLDMGDLEGARSILEEVVRDGNDSQKQEAQALLDDAD
jgi:pilus assembly protein FimV